MASAKPPLLWYVTDPMCSWCWGFTPVIEAVQEEYGSRLTTELMLGGLHPNATEPLTDVERHDLLHDWRQVHERTEQPFDFEHAMPPGFFCDSEPPSRAVMAAMSVNEDKGFAMMKAIQFAFYAGALDVTNAEILAEIAVGLGLNRSKFLKAFESDEVRSKTQAQFIKTRQMGVRGLPALVLQHGDNLHHICSSWQPLAKIRAALDAELDNLN